LHNTRSITVSCVRRMTVTHDECGSRPTPPVDRWDHPAAVSAAHSFGEGGSRRAAAGSRSSKNLRPPSFIGRVTLHEGLSRTRIFPQDHRLPQQRPEPSWGARGSPWLAVARLPEAERTAKGNPGTGQQALCSSTWADTMECRDWDGSGHLQGPNSPSTEATLRSNAWPVIPRFASLRKCEPAHPFGSVIPGCLRIQQEGRFWGPWSRVWLGRSCGIRLWSSHLRPSSRPPRSLRS
jgi:hypothetical protein